MNRQWDNNWWDTRKCTIQEWHGKYGQRKNNIIFGFNISYFHTLDEIHRVLSPTVKVKEIDMNVNKAQGWEKRGRHSVLVKIMQFLNGYRNLKI